MRMAQMIVLGGLGAMAVGCGREPREETAAADSARLADSVAMAAAPAPSASVTTRTDATAPPRVEHVAEVTEQTPGLLAQARFVPLDAQHIAQTKFPTGTVLDGTIERRGGDLVYAFRIREQGTGQVQTVLVDAMVGKLIGSIPGEARRP